MESYVPVPSFYAGKSVFITGGAGYLGKVLLEKLLYSCPEVKRVYVLLRNKRGISPEQRLNNVLELPVFSRLRNEKPQALDKIVVIKGDISERNLGMTPEDIQTVTENVSIVIHSAASVKFNEPLKPALASNLEGCRSVINLCHQIKNIQAFIYISTAFSNPRNHVIEEVIYPPPMTIDEVYKLVDQDKDDLQAAKCVRNLGHPNTYTFTKALAENLISETHGDIPTVIIRPSIVSPAMNEPVQGWVDNWFGGTALLTTIAKGICRVVYTESHHVLDLIPVDLVCNLTIVAAARAKKQKNISVYNSCSGSTNPLTMKQITHLYSEASVKDGFNILPYPHMLLTTKRYWLVKSISVLMYGIAFVADLIARITMKRPRFTKLVSQVIMVRTLLDFFTSVNWLIKSEQSRLLYETLSPSDAALFPCMASDICWKDYIPLYFQGVKKYLLEEKKLLKN